LVEISLKGYGHSAYTRELYAFDGRELLVTETVSSFSSRCTRSYKSFQILLHCRQSIVVAMLVTVVEREK
jgi:hypothetical protein